MLDAAKNGRSDEMLVLLHEGADIESKDVVRHRSLISREVVFLSLERFSDVDLVDLKLIIVIACLVCFVLFVPLSLTEH